MSAGPSARRDPDDPRAMTFLAHLDELRVRLRRAAIGYAIGVACCYAIAEWLFAVLAQPLLRAWADAGLGPPALHFKSPTEPLWVFIKIALLGGLFLSSPVWFHQIWAFVAPGLYRHERRRIVPLIALSAVCFTGGAAFGHFVVFPVLFRFLLGFARADFGRMGEVFGSAVELRAFELKPVLMMEEYVGLVTKTLLGFGLCFLTPVFLMFLGMVGVVDHRKLLRFSRYAIVLIFIVAALVTPDPTLGSQILLAIPLVALYYLGTLLVFLVGRKRGATGPDPDNDAESQA